MKKLIWVFVLVLISGAAWSRVGLGESFLDTPGGHTICHCDPYADSVLPALIGREDSLRNLERFYFYRNHIVGSGRGYFFIYDEASEQLQYFTDRDPWKKTIRQQGLIPWFYTEWLDISDAPFLFESPPRHVVLFCLLLVLIGLLYLVLRRTVWKQKGMGCFEILVLMLLIPLLFVTFSLNVHSF